MNLPLVLLRFSIFKAMQNSFNKEKRSNNESIYDYLVVQSVIISVWKNNGSILIKVDIFVKTCFFIIVVWIKLTSKI